jgi:hypothetical protein
VRIASKPMFGVSLVMLDPVLSMFSFCCLDRAQSEGKHFPT